MAPNSSCDPKSLLITSKYFICMVILYTNKTWDSITTSQVKGVSSRSLRNPGRLFALQTKAEFDPELLHAPSSDLAALLCDPCIASDFQAYGSLKT